MKILVVIVRRPRIEVVRVQGDVFLRVELAEAGRLVRIVEILRRDRRAHLEAVLVKLEEILHVLLLHGLQDAGDVRFEREKLELEAPEHLHERLQDGLLLPPELLEPPLRLLLGLGQLTA